MNSFSVIYAPATVALSLLACIAPPAQAEASGDAPQRVDVVGRRASGAYYDDASGARSDLPLRELPQAIRVMSRQSLDDLAAVRIDDALDFVGGVSRQNSLGGLWDNIAIRGLAGDANNGMALLLNGFPANRGFNAQRDTAAIERLEVLKGTAASLYGASEPGGTINLVSKRPSRHAAQAVEIAAGTHDFYRLALDSTGPVSDTLAYRVNAAVEHRGSMRDHVRSKRALLAPALSGRLSDVTSWDYIGEILQHEAPLDRGVTAIGTRLGTVDRATFLGEPNDGDMRMLNQTHQFNLRHALNDQWSARIGMAYKANTFKGYSTEPQSALQGDQQTLRRQRRYRDSQSDDVTLQAELKGHWRLGQTSHELLAGVEAYRLDFRQIMLRANPSAGAPYAIDVLNPVYGQAQPAPGPSVDNDERQRGDALYLQDAIRLGDSWRVLAGVRMDRYDQSMLNLRSGLQTGQKPSATLPRLGVSYLVDGAWTLFANAGKSYRPNTGADAAGQPFEPEQGHASEIGAKWENQAHTMGATLAVFNIRKQNALTSDPANPAFSMASGAVRSRGLDADVSGQLTRHWRLNASLSYIDASIERDNVLETGGRLLNVPRVNASLLLMYEGTHARYGRYGVGAGVTHTGKRLGEARTQVQGATGAAPFDLPAYTLARLAANWSVSPRVRLSLDIDNLFDRTYYTNSYQRTWVSPGMARSAAISVQTRF